MKTTTPHWIAIGVLSTTLLATGFKFIVMGSTAPANDGRTAVLLEPAERGAVLGEMRILLETTQSIIEALASNDMTTVEKAAHSVGSTAIQTMDFTLRAKLPLEFKKLGFATHYAFDDIADMAKNNRYAQEIQHKLAATMNNCIACHASYQLPTKPLPKQR
ncbi:MAG: hypothetical protein Q9M13_05415 [Mariprofundales bacterium]|nr:hypothetical protein [Mariprofundales bacterium]